MSKMKYSGVDWIGKIPDDWDICRLKHIVKMKIGATPSQNKGIEKSGEIPWYTASDFKELSMFLSESKYITNQAVKDNRYILFPSESILMVCIASIGKLAITQIPCYCNQQITCLMPFHNNEKYIYYGILSVMNKLLYDARASNVVPILNTTYLKNVKITYPSLYTQQKIANFLDEKCSQIDRLISNQEKQIENLKAYKQSLITETVTKGLNSNVETKDSKIYYIGEIPSDWDVSRFKNIATLSNGKEVISSEGNIPVYGSGGIFKYTSEYIFDGVSLLMGRKGTIDRPMLVNGKFWTVDTMFYTSNIKKIQPKYLYYCAISIFDFKFYKSGSVLPSMTQSEINNIFLPSPSIVEQQQIIEYLDDKCFEIDKLIEIKQQKIEKLNEYKKSLIYEYVTGKKEVV